MSLTQELRRENSPIHTFLKQHFPDKDGFWHTWSERIATLRTTRPQGPLVGYPWALVGTAIDYRIRVCWQPFVAEDTVAAIGGRLAHELEMGAAARVWPDLRDQWNLLTYFITPPRPRALAVGREDRIARMSIIMAAYEGIARSGRQDRLLQESISLNDALHRVPNSVVADFLGLLDRFRESKDHYLYPQLIELNPVFDGSALVGGADGDAILDHTLWDFKTTIHPERASDSFWPYQLLGYGLLDLNDQYKTTGAGIYLVRQGAWLSWSWPDLIRLLGGDASRNMQHWRGQMLKVLH